MADVSVHQMSIQTSLAVICTKQLTNSEAETGALRNMPCDGLAGLLTTNAERGHQKPHTA